MAHTRRQNACFKPDNCQLMGMLDGFLAGSTRICSGVCMSVLHVVSSGSDG